MLTKFRELMRLNVCEMCISLVKLMFTCLSSLTMCLLGCVCVCVCMCGDSAPHSAHILADYLSLFSISQRYAFAITKVNIRIYLKESALNASIRTV